MELRRGDPRGDPVKLLVSIRFFDSPRITKKGLSVEIRHALKRTLKGCLGVRYHRNVEEDVVEPVIQAFAAFS